MPYGIHNNVIETRGATTSLKLRGPIPWSRLLLPFYRKKLDRSTQFGAVGYIITLYSSKSYVKSWGVRPNFGGSADPPVVAPMIGILITSE